MADKGLPNAGSLPSNIKIRKATTGDYRALTDSWYSSFFPSHPFFTLEWKPEVFGDWWIEAWRLAIEEDKSMHVFCAIDTEKSDKVVAFVKWREPQADLNLDELWPELPKGADLSVMDPFFGGMHDHRQRFMKKPYWFLELLGTNEGYQRLGIAEAFIRWGCDLADKEDMEVYIDASEKGAPFYQKHFGAVPKAVIPIPKKPETYGTFTYVTHIIPAKSERTSRKRTP